MTTTTTYYAPAVTAAPSLWARGGHSPLGELARFRISRPGNTALVLLDRDGRAVCEPREQGSLLRAAFGGYRGTYTVDTAPRSGTWQLPPGSSPATLEIVWWVAEPTQVVLGGDPPEGCWATVVAHLDRRIRTLAAQGDGEGGQGSVQELVSLLAQPQLVDSSGLACCLADSQPTALPRAAEKGAPPLLWSPQRREEYEFYLEAVRTGPDALAALWLLHHPQEVRQVLEWMTAHPGATAGPAPGPDVTRTLLEQLSPEEREQLAKAMAERIHAMAAPEPPPYPAQEPRPTAP